MKLSSANSATNQTNCRHTLELTPAATAELFPQAGNVVDRISDGNRFNFTDLSNNFKIHCPSSFANQTLAAQRIIPLIILNFTAIEYIEIPDW